VTGSRLRYSLQDIRANGFVDTPAPVTVFNRQRIDQLGASSVGQILSYAPQQPFRRFEGSTISGAEITQLRGLGFDSTLILVNGRRTIPSANTVSVNTFDLNTIPLAAVERVEILSDSASAVYGADAVGGVINVILKKDVPRPMIDVHYGAADGGAEERRISLSGGYSTDRLHTLLVLDYFDRGLLLGSDRERWADQDYRRFGSADRRTTATRPGNITSLTMDNLPGLPSRFAAVPAGRQGQLTQADFLATAGQQNKDSLLKYSAIVPQTNRRSAAGFADFDITSAVNVFAELLYANRRNTFQYDPLVLDDVVVPATNYYNPFGVDVSVDYVLAGLGPTQPRNDSELIRAIAGLRGAVGKWDWELSALNTDEDSELWFQNRADPIKVFAALAQSDPARALNVFEDGPGGSPEFLASLLSDRQIFRSSSTGTQGLAVIRGQLGMLPAGAIETVLGGEWLDSDIVFKDDFTFVEHGRSASAAFAELRVPIVNSAMQIPAVDGLSLTLAARNDHYSDFGDSFNPQFGLVWRPNSSLLLRASYGTAFRAPSLYELHAPRQEYLNVQILDPVRGNEPASVRFITGGNPELEATEADSFTAGLVLTPESLRGLQLSSTYWRLQMRNGVKILPFNIILANAERFADRIVRAPASDTRPGVLQSLDVSYINFGSAETSGIDMAGMYSFDTRIGRFSPSVSATWVADYKVVDLPDTPEVDTVGLASNVTGSILKWRATATVGWAMDSLGLSATGRYSPAYDDAHPFTGRTGRRIPSQFLLDLQATLDIEKLLGGRSSWLPGLKLTAGASNVFDEEPHFSEVTDGLGFDPSQGDLRQRFMYMRLSTTF
jgi:iron complex outermembrane recepter protein